MRSDIRSDLSQARACALLSAAVAGAESKSLQIFFVDVEGGQATLVVTPSGQSLLIDTGWPGFGGRDAGRIVSAAKAAGADRIDYVLITHFHRDHVGGVTQLASQIKIGTFIDHGSNLEDADATENARSVGVLITFGKLRFIDLGDLTKQKERDLVCPNNLIGTVDLFLTTHHGWNQSNAKVIVDALHPRVSIMNNGAHKGGSPDAWETIRNSPGLQDLWQLHYAMDSDKALNVQEMFI